MSPSRDGEDTERVGGPLDIDYWQPSWRDRRRLFLFGYDRFDYSNFIDLLADVYGRRTAFVLDRPIAYPSFAGDVLSYEDVRRLVDRFAAALRRLGVEPGDRVGLMTMNRVDMVFCSFAAGKIGAIPVPMSAMLTAEEIEGIVRRAGARVVVTDPFVFANIVDDPARVPTVRCWALLGNRPDGRIEGAVSMGELMSGSPEPVPAVRPRSKREPAVLFFTSGTTGSPKGAMLSHEATMVFVRHHGRAFALHPRIPRHLALLVMPVAHAGGYAAVTAQLAMAEPTYFMSRFDPPAILDAIERFRPTLFAGTPTMFRMLQEAGAHSRDLSSIRLWAGGADVFPDELIAWFREAAARPGRFGGLRKPMFIRGYGLSETNAYLAQTPPFECGDGCLGWVLPPVRFRIVDPTGNEVEPGRPGELWLSGPTVATSYWNDPKATEESIADDWFRTGDIVRQGKWRMLYFVGRSSEMLKVGGYKVSTAEIDNVVGRHPRVRHAATVGIPDPVRGELPVTAVVLDGGAPLDGEEIAEWAARRLAPYKRPQEVIVMPDLPLTLLLKPKRAEIRKRIIERSEARVEERALLQDGAGRTQCVREAEASRHPPMASPRTSPTYWRPTP